MKKIITMLLCAAALVSLCACGGGAKDSENVEPGTRMEDGTLVVALAGNPTTGYDWSCESDGSCLNGGDYEYVPDAVDEDVVGSGGVFVFRFTPAAAGTETLRFAYARSWEDEVLEEYTLTVTVSGTEGAYTVEWTESGAAE